MMVYYSGRIMKLAVLSLNHVAGGDTAVKRMEELT
jgi:hypothetical protein